ncbi:MAG: PadR family transcriptional regulator [Solirubrobacterales bacterium]|nr:PadR family transcriptional regulator [Solirubrobacterales bacterium]
MHGHHYSRHLSVHPTRSYGRSGHYRGRGRGRGGPRARRGDIRAAVLTLLAEKPMHGYEMIKELEDRTGGAWRPSAGSIYPTLQLLEDEGLIEGQETEGKRRFTLTDAGRAAEKSHSGAAPWDEVTAGADPEQLRLVHAGLQLREAVGQVLYAADAEQRKRVRELLDETRRRIYGILGEEG